MTTVDRLELELSEWLDAESAYHLPDHLGEVVAQTAVTRQRPCGRASKGGSPWMCPLARARSLPPRLGRVILIGLLVLALVGLAIVAAGSRQPRLPAPYGLARNGVLISSADGDIAGLDPVTYASSPLIGGPSFDFGPLFARDGTRFLFLRGAPDGCGQPDCGLILVVANADGTGVHELTAGVPAIDQVDWSPDGTQIAILAQAPGGNGHVIEVVDADGSGRRSLDVGRPAHAISWLPPEGDEIVFRGEQLTPEDPPSGIFAVRPDGSGLRQISTRPAADAQDFQGVAVSPDGISVAYQDAGLVGGWQVHIIDLATRTDRQLPAPAGAAQRGPVFSPDGTQIAYLRIDSANRLQLVVAPADGSGTGVGLGTPVAWAQGEPSLSNYAFTPDGKAIIANDDAELVTRLLPIDGSPPSVLARGELSFAVYQRIAP